MKEYKGNCVSNPFRNPETLSKVIDGADQITKRTFLKYCAVDDETLKAMREFPSDYEFYKYGNIYFYTWSAIEYFYI